MTKITHNENLETSDLGLTTTLVTLNFPLVDIKKTSSSKALFIFKRIGGIDTVINSYWQNALEVNPLEYFNNLKSIKTRLYSNF